MLPEVILSCTTAALAVMSVGCSIQLYLLGKKKAVKEEHLDAMFNIIKHQSRYYESDGEKKDTTLKDATDAWIKEVEKVKSDSNSKIKEIEKNFDSKSEKLKKDCDSEIAKLKKELDNANEKAEKTDIENKKLLELNNELKKQLKDGAKAAKPAKEKGTAKNGTAAETEESVDLEQKIRDSENAQYRLKSGVKDVSENLKKALNSESPEYLQEQIRDAIVKIQAALKK